MSSVSVRLPEDVAERLHRLAKLTGRTKSYYIIEAIRDHLDDLEDLYFAELELEAVHSGRSRTAPLEEIMKRYGMEG